MSYTLFPHLLTMEIYSHGVRCTKFQDDTRRALTDYARRFAQYGNVPTGRGQYESRILRVFAAYTRKRDEFFFHRNQLPELKEHLYRHGVPEDRIKTIEFPAYAPEPVEFIWKSEKTPREAQQKIMDFLLLPTPPIKVVNLQAGQGKAQPLDAAIKTPGGWSTMGEMQIGTKIIAKDGTETEVTGVYPQGPKEIFKVTFADGRSAECCAEHLWKIHHYNVVPANRSRVVNTEEVARLIKLTRGDTYIDLIDPEDTPDVKLPIDPYAMGILIGDGHMGPAAVCVSTGDEFIVEELRKTLPETMNMSFIGRYDYRFTGKAHHDNPYLSAARALDLSGKTSAKKFIPPVYLNGSLAQRLALIQGLMDADGTVQVKGGSVSYSTVSLQLAEDVQQLVWSLGGIAAIRSRQTHYTHKGERRPGLTCYDVDIRYKVPSQLFRLPRKKTLTRDEGQYTKNLRLKVKSVESVGVRDAQCISVAHPERLYVTDDYIVTHNTLSTMFTMREQGERTVLIMKPMFLDQWLREFNDNLKFVKGDIMVVKGSKALKQLMELAKDDPDFAPKVILISNATFRDYIKDHLEQGPYDLGWPCKPWEFQRLMKAGIRVIDEVHLDIHFNFVLDTMTHVPKSISLSATLESDDRFMNEIYKIMFPPNTWAPTPPARKYIDIYAVKYRIVENASLRYLNLFGQYSHTMYEKSIMKRPKLLKAYVKMILDLVGAQFVDKRLPEQKAVIFCGLKEMCEAVVKGAKERWPTLDTRRFVDVDPESTLSEADMIVTTLQSCGTGKDIHRLYMGFSTVALSAKQANQQMIGRLRELDRWWPGSFPRFYFLSNGENPKHTKYAQERQEKLDGKVRSFNSMPSTFLLTGQ